MIRRAIKRLRKIQKSELYSYLLHNDKEAAADKFYGDIAKNRAEFVSNILPKGGIGIELGVLKGHFSRILLDYAQPEHLHLVDPWYMLQPFWPWAMGNQSTVDAAIRVLNDYRAEIEAKRVSVHAAFDTKLLTTFPDNHFDWAYIDSSHAYQHTKDELELLVHKVKNDGVIAGDDWRPDPNHRHHGVFKAVTEFIQDTDFEYIYSNSDNLQWAIKRKVSSTASN